MSGLPGGEPGATIPNWMVNAWNSASIGVIKYQFGIAAKFWGEVDMIARDMDVKIALELHPQNLVFNVPTIRELVESAKATNIGVELDASHLFWQQMDPIAVVRELGPLVYQAAAKDVLVNSKNAELVGVLDNSFRVLDPAEDRVNLGGDEWVNEWPQKSAWDFVAVGKGHGADYWARFISACEAVDPGMWLNIEHEDTSMGRIEGLEYAANTLKTSANLAGVSWNSN